MKEVQFIQLEQVLLLHHRQIVEHGGELGVRDTGLLESALHMPTASYGGEYLHTDIYEMAAAYLFHLVKNHPFVDGNKRTGALAAIVFLRMNGFEFYASNDEFADFVLSLAGGEKDKTDAVVFLKQYTKPCGG